MGMKFDHKAVKGVVVSGCYGRISEVVTHRANAAIEESENYHSVTVSIYRNQEAYEAGENPIAHRCERVDYDPTASASFADLYAAVAVHFVNVENV